MKVYGFYMTARNENDTFIDVDGFCFVCARMFFSASVENLE